MSADTNNPTLEMQNLKYKSLQPIEPLLTREDIILQQYRKAGVPVFDVRKGVKMRKRAEKFIRTQNGYKGSKYIRTSYSLTGYRYN